MKERIVDDIARGAVSVDVAKAAIIEGMKRYYGVSNLCFYKSYPKHLTTDYSYASMFGMFGNTDDSRIWYATTASFPEAEPTTIEEFQEVFEQETKIFFDDTEKQYDNLDELKHDYFSLKLAGVLK